MKKLLATALALTLTFGTFALPAVESGVSLADKFAVSASAETYGNFEYEVLDDGTIEIVDYSGNDEILNIPDTINGKKVTSIGSYAFQNCQKFIRVIISDNVKSIGDGAFYGCDRIIRINIPDNLTYVGAYAFKSCSDLTSISLPNTVTHIGDSAFYDCYSLETVALPNNVDYMGNSVFHGCKKITSLKIPNGATNIEDSAFFECFDLTSVTIPDSVTSIGERAFYHCKNLKRVTLPKNITTIKKSTFASCENLASITIPDSVTSIEQSAFNGCYSLSNIIIPESVTTIENNAFAYCKSFTSVTIPNGISSINDSTFSGCYSLTTVTIPNSVNIIGTGAFSYCNNLTNVTIPNSVFIIKGSAFNGCSKLKDVYFNGLKSEWDDIAIGDYNSYLINANIHYVTQKNISSCTISLPTNTQFFRGTRIRPVVTIKDGAKTLKSGTDYTVSYTNNLSVGKATVTITGKGDYAGTVTKNFDIVQRSIGNCDIELSANTYYFNGTRFKPSVKVYCNGVEMYNGNYDVAYTNNLSAGTATVTLTGKKNLKGTVTKTFKINPRNIANCTVELTKNSANKYKPNVAVKIGSNAVYNGNYTVKYVTSSDKKTVKVTITGKGNLSGTVTKTYTVA